MADEIIIETTSSELVEVGVPGPQGPKGDTGDVGPAGPTIADANAPATNNILWQIRTSGFTAASGGRYVANGTFTVTNPASGNNGELFQVVVASGTVTVNGVAYGASRWPVTVARISGAWTTLANTLTENLTLNGTNSTAPNQTSSSDSSLMTRALGDARYGLKELTAFRTSASSAKTDTTLADDDVLVFNNIAQGNYIVTGMLQFTSGSSGGSKVSFQASGIDSSVSRMWVGYGKSAATAAQQGWSGSNFSNDTSHSLTSGGGFGHFYFLNGAVFVNNSTNSIKIRWAQETANATGLALAASSYVQLRLL
jgi:hypothetical protein